MLDQPNNLKKLRTKAKISIRNMAKLLGTSPSQIYYLENGKIKLTIAWLERFAKVLKVEKADIINYQKLGLVKKTKDIVSIPIYDNFLTNEPTSQVNFTTASLHLMGLNDKTLSIVSHKGYFAFRQNNQVLEIKEISRHQISQAKAASSGTTKTSSNNQIIK